MRKTSNIFIFIILFLISFFVAGCGTEDTTTETTVSNITSTTYSSQISTNETNAITTEESTIENTTVALTTTEEAISTTNDITTSEAITTTIETTTELLYEVTFDSSGGEAIDSVFATFGSTIDLPIPLKEGYTFLGWFTGTGVNDTQFTVLSIVNRDITLYARWQINQYTISFISNGGSDTAVITQDYGTVLQQPEDPILEGYTFLGWFSDEEFNNEFMFTTMPASDMVLYAKWQINYYTITFTIVDGPDIDPLSLSYGSEITLPTDIEKEGYILSDWFTDAGFTSEFTNIVMPAYDISLYAFWSINTFTIYFLDINSNIISEATVEYGTNLFTIDLPLAPEIEGKTFLRWEFNQITMPGNDITVMPIYGETVVQQLSTINIDDTAFEYQIYENYLFEYINNQPDILRILQLDDPNFIQELAIPIQVGAVVENCEVFEDYLLVFESSDQLIIHIYDINTFTFIRTINVDNASFGGSNGIYYTLFIKELDAITSQEYFLVYVYMFDDPLYERCLDIEIFLDLEDLTYMTTIDDYVIIQTKDKSTNIETITIYKFSDVDYERLIVRSEDTVSLSVSHIIVHQNYLIISDFEQDNARGAITVYMLDDSEYIREIVGTGTQTGDRFGEYIIVENGKIYTYVGQTLFTYNLINTYEQIQVFAYPDSMLENVDSDYSLLVIDNNVLISANYVISDEATSSLTIFSSIYQLTGGGSSYMLYNSDYLIYGIYTYVDNVYVIFYEIDLNNDMTFYSYVFSLNQFFLPNETS